MDYHFELFHLSVLQNQPTLFPEKFDGSKEDWLIKVFSEEHPFKNKILTEFYYLPTSEAQQNKILFGKIGKHLIGEENLPPQEKLEEYTRDSWIASVVVIDPSPQEDGQKLALQTNSNMGTASDLLKNLVKAINTKYSAWPYHVEVSEIVEPKSFWDFVKENEGKITSVTFDFIAPNMLGADDEFESEMREYRDKENARKVKLSIENPNGINPETEKIKRAVKYSLSGKGKAKARAKGNKRYNSEKKGKKTTISYSGRGGLNLLNAAKKFASKILGRE